MIETLNPTWTHAVGPALEMVGLRVTPEGSSRWTFALANGGSPLVTARIAGGWLALETDFHPSPDAAVGGRVSFWDALAASGTLPGLVKVVLQTDGHLRLRADLLLHEDLEIAARIGAACAGFEFAWAGGRPAPAGVSTTEAPGADDVDPPHLKRICSEAGWPFVERASGKLAVELEVAQGYYQALLIPTGRGARVDCNLAVFEAVPPVCRQATGGLLLAASGAVRLGRAALASAEVPTVARFEVVFTDPPCPLELASAFEGLSVGCSLCGDEVKTLQDAAVAQSYLELRGWW